MLPLLMGVKIGTASGGKSADNVRRSEDTIDAQVLGVDGFHQSSSPGFDRGQIRIPIAGT
jgi:hypothetical protein